MNEFENNLSNGENAEPTTEEAMSQDTQDNATETVYLYMPEGEREYSASRIVKESETAEETVTETVSEAKKPKKRTALAAVYDYIEVFCYALAMMMVLFLFVFRLVTVDGGSMLTTLTNGDKLIISNLFYTPETGDIVVINPENHGDAEEPIIKRVIATEGQTVFIDYENWAVYVNGQKLDEPYIQDMMEKEKENWGDDIPMDGTNVPKYKGEFTVSEGKVFVMGDNRNNSKDSRSREYGEMGVNRILGKVVFRLYPNFGAVD